MSSRRPVSIFRRTQQVVMFLGVSVLAGFLVAGVLLPFTGGLGLSAKSAATGFNNIPDDFKHPPLAQTSYIYDAKGHEIAQFYGGAGHSRDRTVVPGNKISKTMRTAIVAIEDSRFYKHGPIDLKGTLRALTRNAQANGVSQGGSTITQEYVKNVFIEEAGDNAKKVHEAQAQTFSRKIKELRYAIKVEQEMSKSQILTNYLNITFFGERAYGIEAAAERYFSIHASQLNLTQSALLAGMVQSPSGYDPIAHPKAAKTRRNEVLNRMAELHDITKAQAKKAEASKLGLKVTPQQSGCFNATDGEGFFCDYVQTVLAKNPILGKTAAARKKTLALGGLRIYTTLDPKYQNAAQHTATYYTNPTDPVTTAIDMVQPGTGKVLAMAQGIPYGSKKNQTTLNLSVDKAHGGTSGQQTGSTFKPFTAAYALSHGYKTSQVLAAPYQMDYPDTAECGGREYTSGQSTQNEGPSEVGPMDMVHAMDLSVNTYFIQLISKTGTCGVMKLAAAAGVHRGDGHSLTKPFTQTTYVSKKVDGKTKSVKTKTTIYPDSPSATLGTNEIAPLTMAGAYATFANRGVACPTYAITSVVLPGGKHVQMPSHTCKRVMDTNTADTINTMLSDVVQKGTGQTTQIPGREVAGKTGTTDNLTNVWFMGYTPKLVTAVWVGDGGTHYCPHGQSSCTRYPMKVGVTIGPRSFGYNQASGEGTAGPIWKMATQEALQGVPAGSFHKVSLARGNTDKNKNKDKKNKDKNKGNNNQNNNNGGNNNGGLLNLFGGNGGNNGHGHGH